LNPSRNSVSASCIEAGIQLVKVLYDAYPEAIEDNEIVSDSHRYHQYVQTFINSELIYSRQASDRRLMVMAALTQVIKRTTPTPHIASK
jgi:hypothetical protein